MGHIVHSSASRLRNIDAIFFMIGWARCSFHRNRVGTRYAELVLLHSVGFVGHVVDSGASGTRSAELVFLHPVGSAGHVVHSGGFRPQNVNALFFMLGWNGYGFNKKCDGTRYAELVFL
jgi:hypothetical protein